MTSPSTPCQRYQSGEFAHVVFCRSAQPGEAVVTVSRAVGSSTAASLVRLCEAVLNANSLQAQYELDDLFGFVGDGDNINEFDDTDPSSDDEPNALS
jgi:hypothetical protein